MNPAFHTPVLAEEMLRLLDPQPGQTCVDATVGGGGHATLIAERLGLSATLVIVDQDADALYEAQARLAGVTPTIVPILGSFRHLPELVRAHGIASVDCVLMDLGVSSHQLDTAGRGFSFRADAPLDMRMDPSEGETASELLARLSEREIAHILKAYSDERWADRIAGFIVTARSRRPIQTTRELAEVVEAAIPRSAWPQHTHAATRTFQALRIAVNDELGALGQGLEGATTLLRAPGGRIAVISYHSIEDRLVKQTFKRFSGRCECPPDLPICACGARQVLRIITKKPVTPDDDEVRKNPRARSAKLRAAERTQN